MGSLAELETVAKIGAIGAGANGRCGKIQDSKDAGYRESGCRIQDARCRIRMSRSAVSES
jgi:hypothetical protein